MMAIELEVRAKSQQALGELSVIDTALAKISKRTNEVEQSLSKIRATRAAKELGSVSDKMRSISATNADKKLTATSTAANNAARALNTIGATQRLKTTAADADSLSKGLGRANTSMDQLGKQDMGLKKVNEQLGNINKNAAVSATSMRGLTSAAVGIGSAFATAGLFQFADSITNLSTKIALVTKTSAQAVKAFTDITDIAFSTRTSLDATATLYNRIARSATALQASQKEVAIVTQTVAKAIAASGSTATEAESAILQLGQALASGRLQGDELRSITENAAGLSNAIADGMDVTIGKLREMGEAGELSATKVFEALLKQSGKVNQDFSKIGVTFSQAFANMGNAVKLLGISIGKIFEGLDIPGIINGWAIAIGKFASRLDWKFNILSARFHILIDNIRQGFNQLSIDAIKLNIDAWLPSFDTVTAKFKEFVTGIERLFFWLWDKVIGHSWWTDMVETINTTSAGLMGAPLANIKRFGTSVSDVFQNAFETAAKIAKDIGQQFKTGPEIDARQQRINKEAERLRYINNAANVISNGIPTPNIPSEFTDTKSPTYTAKRLETKLDLAIASRDLGVKPLSEPGMDRLVTRLYSKNSDIEIEALQKALSDELTPIYTAQAEASKGYLDIQEQQYEMLQGINKSIKEGNEDTLAVYRKGLENIDKAAESYKKEFVSNKMKQHPDVAPYSEKQQKVANNSNKDILGVDLQKYSKEANGLAGVVNTLVAGIAASFNWLSEQLNKISWFNEFITKFQMVIGALAGLVIGLIKSLIPTSISTLFEDVTYRIGIFLSNLATLFSQNTIGEGFVGLIGYLKQVITNFKSAGTAADGFKAIVSDIKNLFKTKEELRLESLEKLRKAAVTNISKPTDANTTAAAIKSVEPAIRDTRTNIEKLRDTFKEFSTSINKSPFVTALKQAAGMKNKSEAIIPYTYTKDAKGHAIEGQAMVDPYGLTGAGPQRYNPKRLPGADFINALPSAYQVPVFVAISTGLVLLINKLFGGFAPTSALTQLSTTVLGVVGFNIINDVTLNKARDTITDFILNMVKASTTFLFGSMEKGFSSMNDPFTLLSTMAKLSLVFKGVRDAAAKLALDVAKSVPQGASAFVGGSLAQGVSKASLYLQERQLKDLATNQLPTANTNLANAQAAFANAVRAPVALGMPPNPNSPAAIAALASVTAAQNAVDRLTDAHSRLTTQVDKLKTSMAAASAAMAESRKKAKEAIVGGAVNAGGALGYVYGYKAGENYADNNNIQGTHRLGVQVASAAIGAAIAGAIVGALSSSIGAILSIIGSKLYTLILVPFGAWLLTWATKAVVLLGAAAAAIPTAVAVGIAAAVAAIAGIVALIWNWDTIKPIVLKIGEDMISPFKAAWEWISGKFNDAIEFVKKVFHAGFPEGMFIVVAKLKEWQTAISNFFTLQNFKNMGNAVLDGFISGLKAIGGWLANLVSSSANAAEDTVRSGVNNIKSGVNNLIGEGGPKAKLTFEQLPQASYSNEGRAAIIAEAMKEQDLMLKEDLDTIAKHLTPTQRMLAYLDATTRMEHSLADYQSGRSYQRIVGEGGYFDPNGEGHPNKVGLVTKAGPSTAAGAFQIVNTTWNDPKLGFNNNLGNFRDPTNQVAAGAALIQRRGALNDVLEGNIVDATKKLPREWEGLPDNARANNDAKRWEDFTNAFRESAAATLRGDSPLLKAIGNMDPEAILAFAKGFPEQFKEAAKAAGDKLKEVGKEAGDAISTAVDNQTGFPKTTTDPANGNVKETIKTQIEKAQTIEDSINILNEGLAKFNIKTLSPKDFDALMDTPEILNMVTDSLTLMSDANDRLGGTTEYLRAKLEKDIARLKKSVKEELSKQIEGADPEKAYQPTAFGKTFQENFAKEFNDSLTNVMMSKMTAREAFKKMWETLSMQFVNQMTTSFMNSLLKGIYSMMDNAIGLMDASMIRVGEQLKNLIKRSLGFTDPAVTPPAADIDRTISGTAGIIKKLTGSAPADSQMSKDPTLGLADVAGGMCTKMTSQMEMCGSKITEQVASMSMDPALPALKKAGVLVSDNPATGGINGSLPTDGVTPPSFFGSMTKWFTDMFGGIWKLAQGFGSGLMDMLGGIGKFLASSFDSIIKGASSLFQSIASLFSGSSGNSLFEGASTVIGAIGAFFATGGIAQFSMGGIPSFASGTPKSFNGKISGFGTGTSDSILAWVGNGEYIVNERKTRENRQLLDAINFGKDIPFPKFAKGGGALDTGMLAVSDPKISSKKDGNTTVINWTITGDISRQTRREIQQMIPQIATGVNAHNVENNYRR